ncbi:hypothetical protein GEMRC1_001203 [Eukaryota sp. GEM-RC1]
MHSAQDSAVQNKTLGLCKWWKHLSRSMMVSVRRPSLRREVAPNVCQQMNTLEPSNMAQNLSRFAAAVTDIHNKPPRHDEFIGIMYTSLSVIRAIKRRDLLNIDDLIYSANQSATKAFSDEECRQILETLQKNNALIVHDESIAFY